MPYGSELLNKSGNTYHLQPVVKHSNKYLYYTSDPEAGFMLLAAQSIPSEAMLSFI